MDTPDNGTGLNTHIGIIGRGTLSDPEKKALNYFGRCLATLGKTLVYVSAKGTADEVRKGIEALGGQTQPVESEVIETAHHTFIYGADQRLLNRLVTKYPDIENRPDVTLVPMSDLLLWIEATKVVITEKGLLPPQ